MPIGNNISGAVGDGVAVIPNNANGSRVSVETAIVLKRFKKNDEE
jgi:hypothetical protein